MVTSADRLARTRRRIRAGQWGLVGVFAAVGVLLLFLPLGRTEFRSEILHMPFVLALAAGAAFTAWSTWVRFRMDGTSRAWLLAAAFGVLALLFAPHALYDSSGPDPVGFFYGPASRLAFGVLLIIAMTPVAVPRVLRQPRTTALLLILAVIALVDVVLHADWVQQLLEPDPRRSNQMLEIAALAALGISIVQFGVKWIRTRRRIMITWIAGVLSVALSSALTLPSAGWELRWWWAHLGVGVAAAVFVLGTDRQMRGAIDRGELRLVYQPKVDLVTDELTGVEALLRWQHPDQGLVPAGDFIPLAEETELITSFTLWAIGEAVAQHRRWLDQGLRIPIAVNVTARLLRDSRLIDSIKQELADKELEPGALSLELTESKALESEDSGAETLAALAAFGLSIAVDDFGTGYSSLSYLRNLPVSEVKLDRSFVATMASSQHDYTIVSSTVQLAHALGLKVIAEGIEDEQVADLLARLGCEVGQGYLWSRPLPPDELIAWTRHRSPKPRERGEGGTYAAKERANSERLPGSVGHGYQGARPPEPTVEDRQGPYPEPAPVEHGDGDRGQKAAPLLRDLPASADDGGAQQVGHPREGEEGYGKRQSSAG